MATENIKKLVTRQAGTNITNKRFVVEVAGGIVNRAAVQGAQCHGVVAMVGDGFTGTAIAAGDEAPVAKSGDVIVEAGAAIADAAEVMTDNTGRAITFAAGGGALALGRIVNGGATTNGAGDDVTVELYEIAQHI